MGGSKAIQTSQANRLRRLIVGSRRFSGSLDDATQIVASVLSGRARPAARLVGLVCDTAAPDYYGLDPL